MTGWLITRHRWEGHLVYVIESLLGTSSQKTAYLSFSDCHQLWFLALVSVCASLCLCVCEEEVQESLVTSRSGALQITRNDSLFVKLSFGNRWSCSYSTQFLASRLPAWAAWCYSLAFSTLIIIWDWPALLGCSVLGVHRAHTIMNLTQNIYGLIQGLPLGSNFCFGAVKTWSGFR